MSAKVQKFFDSLQRRPTVISGHVASVVIDSTTGEQRRASVLVGDSTIVIPLDALAPRLGAGDAIRLTQYGTAAAAEYRVAGLETGARPGSGAYQMLDNGTVLGGGTYQGGDWVFGKLSGGNVYVEYATGRLYHRIGLSVNGIEYPDGSQLFGHAALDGGDYAADGANVYIVPSGGVKIRNGIVDALTIDATNGIRQYSAGVQRSWFKQDGSGWLAGSDKLTWDASGNVALSGAITATSGAIGGWTLGATALTSGSGATTVGLDSGGTNPAFYAGSATPASAPFRVTQAGALVATSATITGAVNASSGTFSGLVQIGSGTPHLHLDGANALLESSNYVAGSTGWRIDSGGNAELNSATIRGAIKTAVFQMSQISAFAGSQIVAKSASTIFEDCTLSGTTYTLKVLKQGGAAPFANTDIVRLKDGAVDAWATVNAGTDGTTHWIYTATYQSGSTSGTLRAGHAVVDYGQSGQGYYIVSADGMLGASAAWALRSHAGAPWTTETTHVYAGTDGKLYAGGGDVLLDNDGISFTSNNDTLNNKLSWIDDSSNLLATIHTQGRAGTSTPSSLKLQATGSSVANQYEDSAYISIIASSKTAVMNGGKTSSLVVYNDTIRAESALLNFAGPAVFNDVGANVDLRIEGDTDANLFFVDASTDRVGIGTNAPQYKLDVVGSVKVSGDLLTAGIATNNNYFHYWLDNAGGWTNFGVIGLNNANELIVRNAAAVGMSISSNSLISFNGNVGIGTTAPDRLLHVEVSDSATNAVTYAQRLSHITSGTAAAGFGTGIEFELENASGVNVVMAALEAIYTDATNASEDGAVLIKSVVAGTLTESARFGEMVGIGTTAPSLKFSVAEKVGMTPDGGLAVKLVAGEALTRGEIVYVKIASGADGKVWKTVYTDNDAIQMPIGFVYASASADAAVWIVTSGIAYALPESGITATRGNVAYVSNAESGRVEQSASTPTTDHWKECGHWLDTGSGNGALTRLAVHFN